MFVVNMHLLLLAGLCGLALINISEAQNPALRIAQKPRFYGVKTGSTVGIFCLPSKTQQSDNWRWYWSEAFNETKMPLPGGRKNVQLLGRFLSLANLRIEDSGLYFCEIDGSLGSGTWLQVARNVTVTEALYRSNMKDGLMIFQGLLLAACVAALLLRKREMKEKKDIIYEDPETDHIYQGLEIETCSMGLYEELSVYAQADGAEAPWE
ncbi:B-cell antigen receptor complex-associated protein beta chain [Notolabrus celidotus]|uniref:B-cell antigen receptor complex-associated protein beta chain n=1 Tax=Notolabrus celidotus TaxID=1203425 RepID=UPI00149025EE|nr:B-cell antigen receptor complex-associated protein beta chain [Notolabrus celidotus]